MTLSHSNSVIEGDGLCENVFHLLWSKDPVSDSVPLVRIPHTVIYKWKQPSYWYFTSIDGTIKRKTQVHTNNTNIELEFNKKVGSSQIVAVYMYNQPEPNGNKKLIMEYLDSTKLHEFLYSREKEYNGILQKFVHPKGSKNLMLRSLWSPKVMLLERRVNKHRLDDTKIDMYERATTFEGPGFHSELTPIRGKALSEKVHDIALSIAHHITAISSDKIKVSRMAINITIDENDRLWFLMTSSIRLDDELKRVTRSLQKDQANMMRKLGIKNTPLEEKTTLAQPLNVRHAQSISLRRPATLEKTQGCPLCGSCNPKNEMYELFNKTMIEYEETMRAKKLFVEGSLPPIKDNILSIIQKLYPEMDESEFQKNRRDTNFLYQTVPLCEECSLRFSELCTNTNFGRDVPAEWMLEDENGSNGSTEQENLVPLPSYIERYEEEQFFGTKNLEPDRLRNRYERTRQRIQRQLYDEKNATLENFKQNLKMEEYIRKDTEKKMYAKALSQTNLLIAEGEKQVFAAPPRECLAEQHDNLPHQRGFIMGCFCNVCRKQTNSTRMGQSEKKLKKTKKASQWKEDLRNFDPPKYIPSFSAYWDQYRTRIQRITTAELTKASQDLSFQLAQEINVSLDQDIPDDCPLCRFAQMGGGPCIEHHTRYGNPAAASRSHSVPVLSRPGPNPEEILAQWPDPAQELQEREAFERSRPSSSASYYSTQRPHSHASSRPAASRPQSGQHFCHRVEEPLDYIKEDDCTDLPIGHTGDYWILGGTPTHTKLKAKTMMEWDKFHRWKGNSRSGLSPRDQSTRPSTTGSRTQSAPSCRSHMTRGYSGLIESKRDLCGDTASRTDSRPHSSATYSQISRTGSRPGTGTGFRPMSGLMTRNVEVVVK